MGHKQNHEKNKGGFKHNTGVQEKGQNKGEILCKKRGWIAYLVIST